MLEEQNHDKEEMILLDENKVRCPICYVTQGVNYGVVSGRVRFIPTA
jgi:hypothetical protein